MEPLPFTYNPSQSFFEQFSDWIGDVFYEILPEVGFELRDEQIYMAFQLERAYPEKKIIFSEAGVGTGKTIVYLLYAICYARFTRKPAIIACADESLIEQLVKPEGDIAKLVQHLNVTIDARLAKSMDQYVCLQKLDQERSKVQLDATYDNIYEALPAFVTMPEGMQAFYPYGDRKDYPHLNDESWNKIGWDMFQDCFVCDKRHRCGQTLSRDHYRKSADLIICSHDFYMEHVWTAEGRKREGQLPLLPEVSSVVFDEGHLLEVAAQKALTYKLRHTMLENILNRLQGNEVRERFAVLIDDIITYSESFFDLLRQNVQPVRGSHRQEIIFDTKVTSAIEKMIVYLDQLEEEIVFESGMFTIDTYQLRIVEEHIEMIHYSLGLLRKADEVISWVTEDQEGLTLTVMPRLVQEVLREKVFSQRIPFVFSSATLSIDKSFHYLADSLGIEDFLSFSVESPYDYANQMKVFAPRLLTERLFNDKFERAMQLIKQTNGRALLLFADREDLNQFKKEISQCSDVNGMNFLYEGDQEISHLISTFQREETSILCAVHLWEGLDIPGPSLTNLIIWSLPFPPNDPIFTAKRKRSLDPLWEVDVPYMLLRLKQGIGRLIRSREDSGIVTIFHEKLHDDRELLDRVKEILPEGVDLLESMEPRVNKVN